MSEQSCKWRIKGVDKELTEQIAGQFKIAPATAALLAGRGLVDSTDIDMFLHSKLSMLHDPFLMNGMNEAVDRIMTAKKNNEKVLIHGDYDVDGITAAVLLGRIFKTIGIKHEYYIPHRVEEGYGLSSSAVKRCLNLGVSLLISVDCGITAVDVVNEAKKNNIDVIITDHHEPSDILPDCIAVLDPKIKNSNYPYRELAGVGVAFKLAHGIIKRGRKLKEGWAFDIDLKEHLDLVSLGTVADMVPLVDENRILAKSGLKSINKSTKAGIRALKARCGVRGEVNSTDIAYRLAPRINAAGRLGDAYVALKLLVEENSRAADKLAEELDNHNKKRQEVEAKVLKDAVSQIEKAGGITDNTFSLVLYGNDWPLGVLGIVASRIVRQFYRPALIISGRGGICRGSGRGIEGFHLYNALKEASELLLKYGGHEAAAGFELEKNMIPDLRKRINEYAEKTLAEEQLKPHLDIDVELEEDEISLEFAKELDNLAPFGQGNPSPVFVLRNYSMESRPDVFLDRHIKFPLKRFKNGIEVIGFDMVSRKDELDSIPKTYDLAFRIQIDRYANRERVQMILQDFKAND